MEDDHRRHVQLPGRISEEWLLVATVALVVLAAQVQVGILIRPLSVT